jgi:hypothetical protein
MEQQATVDLSATDRPRLRARISESIKHKLAEAEQTEFKDENEKARHKSQLRLIGQKTGIDSLSVIWQQSDGINDTYQAIRKHLQEVINKNPRKNLSFPTKVTFYCKLCDPICFV